MGLREVELGEIAILGADEARAKQIGIAQIHAAEIAAHEHRVTQYGPVAHAVIVPAGATRKRLLNVLPASHAREKDCSEPEIRV